jgi:hypothetical protein
VQWQITTLKQHSSMLSGDKGPKMTGALKQLDSAITDLHSAADERNQKDAQSALKEVEAAPDQLKSQDPDTAFTAHAIERFKSLLHTTVKTALKVNPPIIPR